MKIVVAYGGTSPEREVSLNSGAAVAAALKEAGHDVLLEDVKSPRSFVEKWDSFNADGVFIASRPVLMRLGSSTPDPALRPACWV